MNRPLIFSASIGHGHQQAAKALHDELETRGYEPEIIDTFQSISPLLHNCVLHAYLKLLKHSPNLWRKIYFGSEKRLDFLYLDKFGILFVEKLTKLIEKRNTPFIISTHPFVTAFLTTLKRKKKMDIPLYTVITDFVMHRAYLREEIDGYFTADPRCRQFAATYNLPQDRFMTTGIPVPKNPAFTRSKWRSRYELGIDHDKKVVLIAGGGIGLTNYERVVHSLEKCHRDLLILCMTGHNKKVEKKVKGIRTKHEVQVIPFTEKFLDYLRASDAIISKSGGLTMAEALICETPIIIYQPVPGHEEHNAKFLMENGVAVRAEEEDDIPLLVNRVFKRRTHDTMKKSAKKLKKPGAAIQIIENIISNMEQKQEAIR
ncbi:MGDG synthase family glycosyltransferase [Bacillus alkalicellulosilyticus]|uniref:MGDG synthase family glycosyltransferase n=1 Tax=Alkalihalobacterium alkalicellulosilyticum TaxID=1912214 RepID=UPI001481FCB9|nr:glycosyltransferase [Bacillus alkalicellulosilyticus]